MRVISLDRDVVKGEVVDRSDTRIEDELRQWAWLAAQLQSGLVEVI
jgi:hypothetical protein